MEIALIGAPGSGKTELALQIQKQHPDLPIVDGYAEDVEKESMLAVGPYQGYVGNTLIAAERLKREIGWAKKKSGFIVCGTLIETMTYMSIYAASPNPLPASHTERTRTFMQFLGMLAGDFVIYSQVFYLPKPEDAIDAQIREAISTWGLPCAKLEGDLENRTKEALRIISEIPSETTTTG